MVKNVVFSFREDHEIIKRVINKLKTVSDVNLYCHDPTKNFFNLSRMPKAIKEADLIIVKVRNDCSIDLLHYAKINKIPTFHSVDAVLTCKNKIALDYALRRVFKNNPQIYQALGIIILQILKNLRNGQLQNYLLCLKVIISMINTIDSIS